jgi:nitrite reductase/ring-hydroxylating ferredoxin subunit
MSDPHSYYDGTDDDGDERGPLDVRVDSPGREGLAGTAPADAYGVPLRDPEQSTRPPDGRPMHHQPQWRKDFPIDWPQDHYVARRDFAKFMVLTSAAFAVGQLWIALQNVWRKRRGQPPITRIASLSSLPIGGSVVFQYPEAHDDCILVRAAPNELVAYSQKCTHLSCAVVPDAEKGILRCPCHEGFFDLATGRKIAGPPPRPLPRITLNVRGDDVYATGVERRTV